MDFMLSNCLDLLLPAPGRPTVGGMATEDSIHQPLLLYTYIVGYIVLSHLLNTSHSLPWSKETSQMILINVHPIPIKQVTMTTYYIADSAGVLYIDEMETVQVTRRQ